MPLVDLALASAAVATVGIVVWRAVQWVDTRAAAGAAAAHRQAHRRAVEVAALGRPGATPATAITVASAAAIEPRAEAMGCPHCDGRVHVTEHATSGEGEDRQRVVTLRCGTCGREHTLYFEIRVPLAN